MKKFRTYLEEIDPSKKGPPITAKDINWDAKSDLKKLKGQKDTSTRDPAKVRVRESFAAWLNAKCH